MLAYAIVVLFSARYGTGWGVIGAEGGIVVVLRDVILLWCSCGDEVVVARFAIALMSVSNTLR